MTQSAETRLDTGSAFPRMQLSTTTGRFLVLPEAFAGHWAVVLLYRGDW